MWPNELKLFAFTQIPCVHPTGSTFRATTMPRRSALQLADGTMRFARAQQLRTGNQTTRHYGQFFQSSKYVQSSIISSRIAHQHRLVHVHRVDPTRSYHVAHRATTIGSAPLTDPRSASTAPETWSSIISTTFARHAVAVHAAGLKIILIARSIALPMLRLKRIHSSVKVQMHRRSLPSNLLSM